jgi:hypothetical protein
VSAEVKICPDCAEEVKAEARICRFCHYRFDVSAVVNAATVPTPDVPSALIAAPQPAPRSEDVSGDGSYADPDSANAVGPDASESTDPFEPARRRIAASIRRLNQETSEELDDDAARARKQKLRELMGKTLTALHPGVLDEPGNLLPELPTGLHPFVLAVMWADELVREYADTLVELGMPGAEPLETDRRLERMERSAERRATTADDLSAAAARLNDVYSSVGANSAAVDAALAGQAPLPFPSLTDARGEVQPAAKLRDYASVVQGHATRLLESAERLSESGSRDNDDEDSGPEALAQRVVDVRCAGFEIAVQLIVLIEEIRSCRTRGVTADTSLAARGGPPSGEDGSEDWVAPYRARADAVKGRLAAMPESDSQSERGAQIAGSLAQFDQIFGFAESRDVPVDFPPLLSAIVAVTDLTRDFSHLLSALDVPNVRRHRDDRKYQRLLKHTPSTLGARDEAALGKYFSTLADGYAANLEALLAMKQAHLLDDDVDFPLCRDGPNVTWVGPFDDFVTLVASQLSKWADCAQAASDRTTRQALNGAELMADGLCDQSERKMQELLVVGALKDQLRQINEQLGGA